MAKAKNKVIAGDYLGGLLIAVNGIGTSFVSISKGFKKIADINKDTVESYELITDDHVKSASSGIARGIVGGILLGPVGALGGALSAKNKGVYQIAIEFKNGKKSLIEIDDKIYKTLIKALF